MELMAKISAAAICASVLSLTIKKNCPEMSVLLSLAVITAVISAGFSAAEGVKGIIEEVRDALSDCGEYLYPVLKCTGIGMITGCASRLCKDCAQSSAASAVELVGTMCAAASAAPMITAALKLIGELV